MSDLTKAWPLGLHRKNWPDYLAWLILALFVLLFFDVYVSRSLQAWPDIWKQPFAFVTDFGLSDWVLIPSLILVVLCAIAGRLLAPGPWRRANHELLLVSSFIFLGVGVPGLASNLLKRLLGRGRPAEFDDFGAFSFQHFLNDSTFQSFPSGHSTTAMAFCFVVGFLAPRFFRLVLIIAIMTGVSRVVIGMHYPTDVVAGFALGMVGAYAVRNFFAARRWLFARLPDGRVRFRGVPHLRRVFSRFQRAAR
ncbi:phosphatase PAP2 family protein [Devosia sp. PTR5]|uniref:Phosphatase PAP2 family protein n=1 Tax=Devosia oryzisoli TaxID=2774138 RepID=A0A927FRX8_9HYPH|nr:phosphatase PAP2 family protein [Devosia oryzisoli]MBD8064901.1 phosphatase PAP2 family protein [Devosia oryzisoli]